MAVYKWTRRATKYFGDVWVPLAQIHLRKTDRSFQSFILQVDSGATVSLLRRSVADLLGLDWESGREVELGGVGGGRTTARLHEIVTKFDDGMSGFIPFAVADNERTPNLLGRLNVFDPLQVDFDGTTHETRISGPWLSEADRRLYDFLLDVDRHVMERWPELDWPERVKEASKRLVQRAAQSLASCAALLKTHRSYDGVIFVRIMFELAAQLEFLLQRPEERAEQYLEYAKVSKYRHWKAIVENPHGLISKFVADSPDRQDGERQIQRDFDSVRHVYKKAHGGLHSNWYCKSLKEMCANDIRWVAEYNQWYVLGSGWAHGDPHASRSKFPMGMSDGSFSFLLCAHYYSRMLLKATDKMLLTSEQYKTLTTLSQQIS